MTSSSSKSRRSERLRNTSVKSKNSASCAPYLESFLGLLATDDDSFISTDDLHQEYISLVKKMSSDKNVLTLAVSKNRFSKNMIKEAARRKWSYVAGPRRGYRIKFTRRVARKQETSCTEMTVTSSPPEVIFIDHKKGSGLFATRDYQPGDVICTYHGQIIGYEEKLCREAEYEQQGVSYKIIDLPRGKFLDGARDKDGKLFTTLSENLAAVANNSFSSPNCRLSRHGKDDLVLVCTAGIPKGTEICWFYADTRKDLPGCSWLFD